MGRARVNNEPTVQLAFRLPESLVNAIDEIAADLAPGFGVSRTQVVRELLEGAVAAHRKGRRTA